MKSNKVLLVAHHGIGRKYLIKGILGEQVSAPSATSVHFSGAQIMAVPWTVDTKYYTARLDIWLVDPRICEDASTLDKVGHECQAIVLAFDVTNASSFKGLTKWNSFIEKFQPSVRLCVGNERCSGKQGDAFSKLENSATEWSISNMVEYLRIPHQKPVEEKSRAPVLNGFREKEGLDRLVEALQTNMYKHSTLKSIPIDIASKARGLLAEMGEDKDVDDEVDEQTGDDISRPQALQRAEVDAGDAPDASASAAKKKKRRKKNKKKASIAVNAAQFSSDSAKVQLYQFAGDHKGSRHPASSAG